MRVMICLLGLFGCQNHETLDIAPTAAKQQPPTVAKQSGCGDNITTIWRDLCWIPQPFTSISRSVTTFRNQCYLGARGIARRYQLTSIELGHAELAYPRVDARALSDCLQQSGATRESGIWQAGERAYLFHTDEMLVIASTRGAASLLREASQERRLARTSSDRTLFESVSDRFVYGMGPFNAVGTHPAVESFLFTQDKADNKTVTRLVFTFRTPEDSRRMASVIEADFAQQLRLKVTAAVVGDTVAVEILGSVSFIGIAAKWLAQ